MQLHILRVKEAPFVFLGLVAILSWLVTHVVNRVTSSSIIEYSIETLKDTEIDLVKCGPPEDQKKEKKKWDKIKIVTISSLSSSVFFKDTVFALRFTHTGNDSKFLGVEVQAEPPAVPGKGECGPNFAKYSNITLYPELEMQLVAAVTKEMETDPILYVISSEKVAVIKEKSLKTFLIKNEMIILISIVSLLIIVLGTYIWNFSLYIGRDDEQEKKDNV